MTTAYFDCTSGISGDMFLGALVDAGLDIGLLQEAIESLGLASLKIETRKVTRLGIAATKVDVIAPREHAHRHLRDIEKIIDESGLPEPVKDTAKRIFERLAAAEAKVHGEPVEKVHFHEVGALDSIADIVGAAAGLHLLGISKCRFSAIPTGSGTVKCAHGILPVPAPATAEILKGVPLAPSDEPAELTTPTGAAIARELAVGYGTMPAMRLESVGSGAGTREGTHTPNILRVFVGEESPDATPRSVVVIEAAIDDMTGEALSFAAEALLEAGALDAYVTPIFMKKARPGHLITALADQGHREAVLEALFRETTTFGARVNTVNREVLERETVEVDSEYGTFRLKVGIWKSSVASAGPEYEDVRRIATGGKMPFKTVYAHLQAAGKRFLDERSSDAEARR